MAITITVQSGEDLREVRARAADRKTIGTIIARILESQSQRAFLEQKLGDEVWPGRYPNMEDPFVNLAAVVNWTNAGGKLVQRFFDRRPALKGEGHLMQSIYARSQGDLVLVGAGRPYAGFHQWGGTSVQQITPTAKRTIGRFIGMEQKDGKWRKKKGMGSAQRKQREKYWFRLAPLLGPDQLETQIAQRPFLGITDENEREMIESIEYWVAKGES